MTEKPEGKPEAVGIITVIRDRWRQAAVLLAGVAVVALYLGGYLRIADPLEGKPAKLFSLNGLDGRAVNLADHLGKEVILLDFWAVWCPPCRKALPELAGIVKDFGQSGLVVYAVNQQDSPEHVSKFLESEKITLPVLLDPDAIAGIRYEVDGIPKFVLIDRTGTMTFVQAGYGPGTEARLRKAIKKALQLP